MGSTWHRFEDNFHKNNGRQWPESEKWNPKAAYRRRMAHVMHIISLRVRPKRVHKQNIFIFPTYFACPRGPEDSIGAKSPASRTVREGVGGG